MSRRSRYQAYLRSAAWWAKRAEALRHYGAKCNRCGAAQNLHVHHIRYGRDLDAIPIRWLEVLCRQCHEQHHRDAATRRRANRKSRKLKFGWLVSLVLDHGDDFSVSGL